MLDTSSRANFKPTAEIDDLDVLAKEVCGHLAASTNAAQNFLEHALAAGDALIRAKKQVKPGNWYGWLRSCDLSEDKAQRYMQLAAHGADLDPARVRGLSLRAALKLIGRPQPANSKPKKKKAATSFVALAWWSSASPEARSRFIEGVGLKPLIAAIPSSWRREAEQAVGPVSPRVTTLVNASPTTRDDIGPGSAGEIARLNARIDELQIEKRRLEIDNIGLRSEVEATKAGRKPEGEGEGSELGGLLRAWDRASQGAREKFKTHVGFVAVEPPAKAMDDGLDIPECLRRAAP
jgi:hypothetical protein